MKEIYYCHVSVHRDINIWVECHAVKCHIFMDIGRKLKWNAWPRNIHAFHSFRFIKTASTRGDGRGGGGKTVVAPTSNLGQIRRKSKNAREACKNWPFNTKIVKFGLLLTHLKPLGKGQTGGSHPPSGAANAPMRLHAPYGAATG